MFDRVGAWFLTRGLAFQLLLGLGFALTLWMLWGTLGISLLTLYWTGSWPLRQGATSVATLGQVGDLFGGINALFAAFAFVGVALAAYYQYRTFKLQATQTAHQSFEPLFFELLKRHQPPERLRPLDAGAKYTDEFGGAWFADVVDRYREWLSNQQPFMDAAKQDSALSSHHIAPQYIDFYRHNEDILGPYFRKLYHIFKFIGKSELPWAEKARYSSIARAGLNKNELLLLALNCKTPAGEDFLPYVEGFGLLRHVARQVGRPTPDELVARHLYSAGATLDTASREAHWKQHPAERPTWAA
jgi:hypothetical protein